MTVFYSFDVSFNQDLGNLAGSMVEEIDVLGCLSQYLLVISATGIVSNGSYEYLLPQ